MAAPITDYTTKDAVRGVLGVNVDEISDQTLELETYALALQKGLRKVGLDLPGDYATIAAKGEDVRTQEEQDVYDDARLFAAYYIAVQLASSLPLFSPKSITDGKSGFVRYSESPYRDAVKEARDRLDEYSADLANSYSVFKGSAAPVSRPWFGSGSPTSDPVAGT